ncbi:MAG: DMT family transporter [Chloroflexi bacterium]|nr:DMT family transporter [Chloroflexota bacterium]
MTRSRQIKADLALLLMTLIWGSTFVMVKDAVSAYPVFPFLAIRFAMATAVLLIVGFKRLRTLTWRKLGAGIVVGLALFAGYSFQTIGLRYTSASKAGFITGLSVILVPLLSMLFYKHKLAKTTLIGVVLAVLGLAALTLDEQANINSGDLIVLGCALAYALHIISIGAFAPRMDPLLLSVIQLATVAVASTAASFITGVGFPAPTGQVWFATAFTGLLATALAFGVQTAAQRFTTPTHTALIFVAEPVFAAIFGVLFAGDQLTARVLAGGILIVLGMIISEVNWNGRTAYIISRFLAPHYVSIPIIFVMAFIETKPWYHALIWAVGVCLLALPIPLLLLQRELRIGRISDWYLRNRHERLLPVPVISVLMAVLLPLIALIVLRGPRLLIMLLSGAAAVSIANLLITLRWKISQHVASAAYAAGALVGVIGLGATPALALVPIVAWARIKLGAHTPAQTILGGLMGFLIAIVCLKAFLII